MNTQTHALSQGTGTRSARWNGLTDTGLKTIALAVMVLDHISYFFGYTGQIPGWFSMAGRLAAPLFLFCLVEGFTHTRSRKRYFLRMLAVAVPMGVLLFLMRHGNLLVRPDGFYPENSMMSTFVLLLAAFQGLEWLTSRRPKRMALGALVLLFLLSWPFLATWLTITFPASAPVVGVLGYTVLPMMNITGDLSLPILLAGLVLCMTRRNRKAQAAGLALVYFGWHFVLVYLQVRGLPDFSFLQMFTTYYEWMGGLLAAPLLLCYNGRRGSGHGRFFYGFYPAHIYLLYALSWLALVL